MTMPNATLFLSNTNYTQLVQPLCPASCKERVFNDTSVQLRISVYAETHFLEGPAFRLAMRSSLSESFPHVWNASLRLDKRESTV